MSDLSTPQREGLIEEADRAIQDGHPKIQGKAEPLEGTGDLL